MKKYGCIAKTLETGKTVTFEVDANSLAEARIKAQEICFNQDLKLVDVQEAVSS